MSRENHKRFTPTFRSISVRSRGKWPIPPPEPFFIPHGFSCSCRSQCPFRTSSDSSLILPDHKRKLFWTAEPEEEMRIASSSTHHSSSSFLNFFPFLSLSKANIKRHVSSNIAARPDTLSPNGTYMFQLPGDERTN